MHMKNGWIGREVLQFREYLSGQIIAMLLDPMSFYCKIPWSLKRLFFLTLLIFFILICLLICVFLRQFWLSVEQLVTSAQKKHVKAAVVKDVKFFK